MLLSDTTAVHYLAVGHKGVRYIYIKFTLPASTYSIDDFKS